MHFRSRFWLPTVAGLAIFAAAGLFSSGNAVAQPPRAESATAWQDLGFDELPAEFSTDEIPLFEGLNEARGTWSYEGATSDGEAATPVKGSLHIMGNPKVGMLPAWKMTWGWPAEDPVHAIHYSIMASPGLTGFDLMLFRVGPVEKPAAGDAQPKPQVTMFQGNWDLENRLITWLESDVPNRLRGQAVEQDSSGPKQAFEMLVAADGKISIRNSKHTPQGQMLSGKALVRTVAAPAEPVFLTGKHSFQTVAEISDPRINPCLPPQAKDISVLSDRGGHRARYKVTEADFKKFLDQLWEAKQDSSAHKRDHMSGEGEPANRNTMANFLKATGWQPLDNAITYFSPSKPNGAMTTYYYDREAGMAYHDRGYW